jgi:hypothetical protein
MTGSGTDSPSQRARAGYTADATRADGRGGARVFRPMVLDLHGIMASRRSIEQ